MSLKYMRFAGVPFTQRRGIKAQATQKPDKMIDAKLSRTFEALQWDIPTPQKTMVKSILKF